MIGQQLNMLNKKVYNFNALHIFIKQIKLSHLLIKMEKNIFKDMAVKIQVLMKFK